MNTVFNEVYNDTYESYAEVNEHVTPMQLAACTLAASEAQYTDDPTNENYIEWLEAQIEFADFENGKRLEMIAALMKFERKLS